MGTIPDISSIAVNADSYKPCVPPPPGKATAHCDLLSSWPGAHAGDAPAVQGFAAQPNLLGFFDFTGVPWANPPTPPTPVSNASLGYNPCNATNNGP